MDTSIDNAFYVFDAKGKYLRFYNCPATNLYRLDIKEATTDGALLSMITVEDNAKEYSSLDCTRARKIRELQHILACPADDDLANAIENNVIGNTNFGQRDIHIAAEVFGPSVPSLKGKTVQQKSKLPCEDEPISVPPTIVE